MSEPDPIASMDRIVVPRHRLRLGLGAVVVLLLIGLAAAVLVSAFGAAGASRTIASHKVAPSSSASGLSLDPQATGPPGTAIFVHLLGAVAQPGLYELRDGDRLVDAIASASGFTEAADQGAVNLARRLVDGEQIYVPVVGEAPPPTVSAGGAGGSPTDSATAKVNLNTADEAALDTLPGVGPTTAASILAWREENGRFSSIEDLLSVDGIGAKTFDELKDLVVV